MFYNAAIKIRDVEELEYRVIEIESRESLPQIVQNIRDEFNNQVMYVKFAPASSSS